MGELIKSKRDGNLAVFECFIYVNGIEVDMLFDGDKEQTFDPTAAAEYLDFTEGGIYPVDDQDEIKVVFNPMDEDDE